MYKNHGNNVFHVYYFIFHAHAVLLAGARPTAILTAYSRAVVLADVRKMLDPPYALVFFVFLIADVDPSHCLQLILVRLCSQMLLDCTLPKQILCVCVCVCMCERRRKKDMG